MRTAIVFVFAVLTAAVIARENAPAAATPLRVCADPSNMPFSNRAGEGFENRIAALVGRDLNRPVQYTWWLQRRSYVRNTLNSGRCDVIIGFPAEAHDALTTTPYYASTYVFAYRTNRNLSIRSFDDPQLRKLRIGVQMANEDYTPPGVALGRRGLAGNVVGFRLYGDESGPWKIMDAVVNGAIDVAIVWGPTAGYYAKRSQAPLTIAPVSPPRDGIVPFTFSIAAAVRKNDRALEQRIDASLRRNRAEVNAILASYGVPLIRVGGDH